MKFRKVLCGVTAAALMLNIASVGAVAAGAEEVRTGVVEKIYAAKGDVFTKDGITYREYNEGFLEIIGIASNITDLVIPETVNGKKVTAVSDGFFRCLL